MKARINNFNFRKILGVNLSEEQRTALEGVCEQLNAVLVTASAEDMEKSAAQLLGERVPPCPDRGYEPSNAPMLLFAGFDRSSLDNALDAVRSAGVVIPLKAMYTPHNRLWSLSHLLNELQAEHNAMNGGDSV